MKYNDNGEYKDIYIKTFDTLPVGAIVEYNGATIPDGWTDIGNNQIKKTSQYIENGASISNVYGTSQSNGYSQEYSNNTFGGVELYYNASGTTGNVQLSDNFSNYSYIEIFYIDDQNFSSSIKIRGNKPNFILSFQKPSATSDTFFLNSTRYYASTNTLSVEKTLIFSITTSGIAKQGSTNMIKIYKVIGYK